MQLHKGFVNTTHHISCITVIGMHSRLFLQLPDENNKRTWEHIQHLCQTAPEHWHDLLRPSEESQSESAHHHHSPVQPKKQMSQEKKSCHHHSSMHHIMPSIAMSQTESVNKCRVIPALICMILWASEVSHDSAELIHSLSLEMQAAMQQLIASCCEIYLWCQECGKSDAHDPTI